jgi:hypothetical protein
MIREIDDLTTNHYILAGIVIPLITTLSLFAIINMGKNFVNSIGLMIRLNPLLLVSFFILALFIPSVVYKIREYS